MRLARQTGMIDRPNRRSLHAEGIPRGGGLAVLTATVIGLIAGGVGGLEPDEWALLLGVLALALTGLADDRFGLRPAVRIVIQLAAACGLVSATGGIPNLPLPPPLDLPLGPLADPVAVLWLVAVTNFYNFLDGIDGLASAQAVITGVGAAWLAWDPFAARTGAALAGGSSGFLAFNWAPARIFLGDVGSLTMGYALAAIPFLAPLESRSAVLFWTAMSLWLFLADATWTVARRFGRGERWFEAHREHLYQRLVAGGMSHARVSGGLAVASGMLTAMALMALGDARAVAGWCVLAVAMAFFLLELKVAAGVS
ncbi:MAG: glycosyltransferase family 4 protein [Dehalococcoidia bacterium]